MIRLTRYGIVLRSMEASDLEFVLNLRNSAHVRENFEYQEQIGPVQHAAWFAGLDPKADHYFIIEGGTGRLGVIHCKAIDWETRVGEAGIFVREKNTKTMIPVLAVLAMMEMLFFAFGFNHLRAKMNVERPDILDFNGKLGYEEMSGQEGSFRYFEVGKKTFLEATESYRRNAEKLCGAFTELEIGDGFLQKELDLDTCRSRGIELLIADQV